MPKTKDKFETVLTSGVKGPSRTFPSSATVVRKGSKYGGNFAEHMSQVNRNTIDADADPQSRRKVARELGAEYTTLDVKRDAKSDRDKYAKK